MDTNAKKTKTNLKDRDNIIIRQDDGGAAPMNIVRKVQKGEKISDLINEGKSLTFTTGNEHALVKLSNGDRVIVSGNASGISFKPGEIDIIFGHTHPTSAPPSSADFKALTILNQSQQTVFHGGLVTKVRKPK